MTQAALSFDLRRQPPPSFVRPGLVTEGDAAAWAVFSEDRRYRYLLGRRWADEGGPLMIFGMLNPSKAGAFCEDPTVRKCIGFAKRWKAEGIVVCNAGAFIATDPADLARAEDPIGEHNMDAIRFALSYDLAFRVAAWGRIAPKLKRRLVGPIAWMKMRGALWCFGTTENEPKEPRHPLMLAYSAPLVSLVDGRPW